MCCLKYVMSHINCICVPLLPYAYIPKRHVRFSNNLSIYSTYPHKMIR